MEALFKRYVTFTDERHAFVCALWCAQTWLFQTQSTHGLDYAGYLTFISPTRNCGKTAALTVVSALSYGHPDLSIDPTAAPLFRKIQQHRYTVIFDELDTLVESPDIIAILNSGYRKKAVVERMGGRDKDQVFKFSTFGPKALAYIRDADALKSIKATLESRCIKILLKKRTQQEQIASPKMRESRLLDESQPLVARLMQWIHTIPKDLSRYLPETWSEQMSGREEEVWENLFVVAKMIGRMDEAMEAAMDLIKSGREESEDHSGDAILLRDIRDNMADLCDGDGFAIEYAVKLMRGLENRPYNKTVDGMGITVQGLGRILAKYGLRPRMVGPRRVRRIERRLVEDVIHRHVPEMED